MRPQPWQASTLPESCGRTAVRPYGLVTRVTQGDTSFRLAISSHPLSGLHVGLSLACVFGIFVECSGVSYRRRDQASSPPIFRADTPERDGGRLTEATAPSAAKVQSAHRRRCQDKLRRSVALSRRERVGVRGRCHQPVCSCRSVSTCTRSVAEPLAAHVNCARIELPRRRCNHRQFDVSPLAGAGSPGLRRISPNFSSKMAMLWARASRSCLAWSGAMITRL